MVRIGSRSSVASVGVSVAWTSTEKITTITTMPYSCSAWGTSVARSISASRIGTAPLSPASSTNVVSFRLQAGPDQAEPDEDRADHQGEHQRRAPDR